MNIQQSPNHVLQNHVLPIHILQSKTLLQPQINIYQICRDIDNDIRSLQNECFLEIEEKTWYNKIMKIKKEFDKSNEFEKSKKRKIYNENINKNKIFDYYENHILMKQKKKTIPKSQFHDLLVKRFNDWLKQPVFKHKLYPDEDLDEEGKKQEQEQEKDQDPEFYLNQISNSLIHSIISKLKKSEKENVAEFYHKLIEMHNSFTKDILLNIKNINLFSFRKLRFCESKHNSYRIKEFHLLNDVDQIDELDIFDKNCVKIFANIIIKFSDLMKIINFPYRIKETFFIIPFTNNREFYKKEHLNENDIILLLIGLDILIDCLNYFMLKA